MSARIFQRSRLLELSVLLSLVLVVQFAELERERERERAILPKAGCWLA